MSYPASTLTSPVIWSGLTEPAFARACASHLSSENITLIVLPDAEHVERFEDSLRFFSAVENKALQVVSFPARKLDLNPSHLSESDIQAKRLATLHHVQGAPKGLVILATIEALCQHTLPNDSLKAWTKTFSPKDSVDLDTWEKTLATCGFERVDLVEETGQYALRGDILDVYPVHSDHPFRVERFDDEIETIRRFDPQTQRSLKEAQTLTITPVREVVLDPGSQRQFRQSLKAFCDAHNLPATKRLPLTDHAETGTFLPSMMPLLPFFHRTPKTLLDHLPDTTQIALLDTFDLEQKAKLLKEKLDRQAATLLADDLVLPAKMLSVDPIETFAKIKASATISHSEIDIDAAGKTDQQFQTRSHDALRRDLLLHRKKAEPLKPLKLYLAELRKSGTRVVLVCQTESTLKHLKSLFDGMGARRTPAEDLGAELNHASARDLLLVPGELHQGFTDVAEGIAFLSTAELLGERRTQRSRVLPPPGQSFASLSDLKLGDPIVHLDFGVGRYRGLESIQAGGQSNDFLHLEYADGDKLYLPVHRLNRVHRYIGSDGSRAPLDRLGQVETWHKAKTKAQKAISDMAEELIALYAKRQLIKRKPLRSPDEAYFQFEESFPFEETRDQLQAIEAIEADMLKDTPMDRLVCGDVGFGKTEIAMRAAYRFASEGQQVAVLVPTTILASQHFQSFKERMQDSALEIDFISRFRSPKEQKAILEKARTGKIDILVGTHRLLSKDVKFQKLGLLILDEEHRFGVKHKERIKALRQDIDVITLTATPIPRTLQLSMSGIRELSVMLTPPVARRPIETSIARFDDGLIRDAILREIQREGQVFFVHNRVETIFSMQSHLKKLLPNARIAVGHGQMDKKALEDTMLRFLDHQYDVLLATTIIESGIDIPRANTILINRADCFGLAQLYQLRGRVGRSDLQSYAYLLVPGEEIISRDALVRLKTIKRFTELGSGFHISQHDLEIRGAGNLLGSAQSGHVGTIGFELYTQLLEREIRKRKGEALQEDFEPEIQVGFPAFLPETYVPGTNERLTLYKRLSSCTDDTELEGIVEEIRDRYGPLPQPAEGLKELIGLKIVARRCGAKKLTLIDTGPAVEFTDAAPINMDVLLNLLASQKELAMQSEHKLKLTFPTQVDVVEETKAFLLSLVERPSQGTP